MTKLLVINKTMKTMNVAEAKTHFSSVIDLVESGETVLICKRNLPVAKITRVERPGTLDRKHRTQIGWAKGTGVKILGDLTDPALPAADWDMMQ